MKRFIILIPVLGFSFLSCTTLTPYGRGVGVPYPVQEPDFVLEPEIKTGALIEIHGKEGGYIVGELIAVRKKLLLLCGYATGADLYVDIRDVKTITIGKKSKAKLGAGIGGLIGGGVGALGALPTFVLLALVAALFVFLTEVTSNTATATMAMPVMAGVATGLGFPAITLMATAALSASMAFMLPVATPPNAIVFGSDYLTIPRMVRAGFWMNLIAITVITLTATFLVPAVLGG